MLDFLKYKTDF